MTSHTHHGGRRRSLIAAAAAVVLALLGATALFLGLRTAAGPPQPPGGAVPTLSASAPTATAPATPTPAGGSAPAKGADLGPILKPSPPVAIDIPSIAVSTRNIVDLGLTNDGHLDVPKDFSSVGWYTKGPSPGQLGPTILSGHVDSHNGPAIFYRLGALRPGARVNVARKDGSTATFTIDRVQRFPKDHFPTAQVYGATNRAELRLITCGGSFDPKTGHYIDNIVAFAHLIASDDASRSIDGEASPAIQVTSVLDRLVAPCKAHLSHAEPGRRLACCDRDVARRPGQGARGVQTDHQLH